MEFDTKGKGGEKMEQLTLRQWRRVKDITVVDMAERLGISKPTYIKWERDPSSIRIGYAEKIAAILGVKREDVFPDV